MYRNLRHLTVHYSEIGKEELAQTLKKYAHLPAQATIRQTESGVPELTFGWVQGIRSMEILGDIASEDFLEKLRSDGEVTVRLTTSWLIIVPMALSLFCHLRQIDMSELLDTGGSAFEDFCTEAWRTHRETQRAHENVSLRRIGFS